MDKNTSFNCNDKSIYKELQSFFKSYPSSQFAIKQLSIMFNTDVYNILLQLENNKLIIRSKVDINGKPVTHWQFNGRSHIYPNDFVSDNWRSKQQSPIIIQTRNNKYLESQRIVSLQNPSISDKEDFNYQKFMFNQAFNNPDASKNEYRSKNTGSDLSRTRIFCKIPKPTNLNINSIEFKPQNTEESQTSTFPNYNGSTSKNIEPNRPSTTSQLVRSKSCDDSMKIVSKSDSKEALNNCSLAFMTAMTKNPVSVLYEFCQQRGMVCEFKTLEMEGPSHKPRISTAVFMNGRQYETVVASNKKEGKRKAADIVIRSLISEGHFAEKQNSSAKSSIKNENKKSKDLINVSKEKIEISAVIYDQIATLVYNKLAEIIHNLSPNEGLSLAGRKVVSAIVMQDSKYDTFEVVSLATGNRCITGDKLSLQGRIVNDSHAEIVARRSFMFFLYKQLEAQINGTSELGELFDELFGQSTLMSVKRFFKVKDHICFHLYISTAPCGDGALFCSSEVIVKKYETEIISSKDHEPLFENSSQGLLRTKIEGGEGTIPVHLSEDCNQTQTLDGILHGERLRTMSCSDKIARWNYLGLQGALLSIFIKPIFLKSIILGNLFHAGHLSRAICCRLEKFTVSPLRGRCDVNHPDLINVYVGELHREIDKSNELSINWCHGNTAELVDGVTGKLSMKSSPHMEISRISKSSLLTQFHNIHSKLQNSMDISKYSYNEMKSLAVDYTEKKKALYLKFHCAKYGSWICKPVEQNDFHIETR